MGNAFQALRQIAQPQVEHILEEKLDEEVDEDDEGGSKDPTAHLEQQLRRMRRGEKINRLTTKLPQLDKEVRKTCPKG